MKPRPWLRTAVPVVALALTVGIAGCRPIGIPRFRSPTPPPRVANLPKFEVPRFNPPRFEPPANLPPLRPQPGLPNGMRGFPEHFPQDVPGLRDPFGRPRPGFPGPFGPGGPVEGPRWVLVPAPAAPHVPAEATAPRVADGALEETLHLANKRDWAGLSRQLETVQQLKLPPELRPSMTSLRNSSHELATLTTLEGLLAEARPGSLGKATKLAEASEPLRQPVRDLESLEGLQASLKTDWKQAPKLADLENGLAAYGRVTSKEKTLELRWQLACAASRRGHRELAQHLVPPERNAADLPPTRDLRPQGAENTAFVGPPRPDERPPILLPEGPPGVRPGVRESVLNGLGDTGKELSAAVATSRQRARAAVTGQKAQHLQHVSRSMTQLINSLQQDRDRQKDSPPAVVNFEQSVANALGRPLTPTERHMASILRAQGKGAGEVAQSLGGLK
jgi:hypothetical protein